MPPYPLSPPLIPQAYGPEDFPEFEVERPPALTSPVAPPTAPQGFLSQIMPFLRSGVGQGTMEALAVGLSGLRNPYDEGRFQETLMGQVWRRAEGRRAEAEKQKQAQGLQSILAANELVAQGKLSEAVTLLNNLAKTSTDPNIAGTALKLGHTLGLKAAEKGVKEQEAAASRRVFAGLLPETERPAFEEGAAGLPADVMPRFAEMARPRLQVSDKHGIFVYSPLALSRGDTRGITTLVPPPGPQFKLTDLDPDVRKFMFAEGLDVMNILSKYNSPDPGLRSAALDVLQEVSQRVVRREALPKLSAEFMVEARALGYSSDEIARFWDSSRPSDIRTMATLVNQVQTKKDTRFVERMSTVEIAKAAMQGQILNTATGLPITEGAPEKALAGLREGTHVFVGDVGTRQSIQELLSMERSLRRLVTATEQVLAKRPGENFLKAMKIAAADLGLAQDENIAFFLGLRGPLTLATASALNRGRPSDKDAAYVEMAMPRSTDTVKMGLARLKGLLGLHQDRLDVLLARPVDETRRFPVELKAFFPAGGEALPSGWKLR